MNKKFLSLYIFIVFCLLSILVIPTSDLFTEASRQKGIKNKVKLTDAEQSYFKTAHYFLLTKRIKQLFLNSFEMVIDSSSGDLVFTGPEGVYYTQGSESFNFESYKGFYDKRSDILKLKQEVKVENKNSNIRAESVVYEPKKNKIKAKENVRMLVTDLVNGDNIQMRGWALDFNFLDGIGHFKGDVSGKIVKRMVYQKALDFSSKFLTFNLTKNEVHLNESVQILYSGMQATARKGGIFLENYNKKLKYFSLNDDVRVKEKLDQRGSVILREAFSERLEGFTRDRTLVLTGYPKVFQQGSVIRGNVVILREDKEVVEVENANTKLEIR